MKKVMIGILILIPIIILFVVAMVTYIASMEAWIGVDDMQLFYKNTQSQAETLALSLADFGDDTKSFYDYFDVKVFPEKANNYSIKWYVEGEPIYTDEGYEKSYNSYLEEIDVFNSNFDESYQGFEVPNGEKVGKYVEELAQIIAGKPYKPIELETDAEKQALKEEIRNDLKKLVITEVKPAVMLVDSNGNEVEWNTSGEFVLASYCMFTLRVEAEHISRNVLVTVGGDDVESVTLVNLVGEDSNQLVVGQSRRIAPFYTPIDSIVGYTQWWSDNDAVATVDQNGVITAHGVGSASIYVKASVHSSEGGEIEYVQSGAYVVEVSQGASQKFGNTVTTARSTISFEDLGISEASVIEGCEIDGSVITLTQDVARVETESGTLTINRCGANQIAIQNATHYQNKEDGGYVLAVGTLTLKLKAVWQDMLRADDIGSVSWTSSNESVATVDTNGEVSAIGRGIVTITATANGQSASITINVQHKLASLQLKTSNAMLAVGVARETVFASEKYAQETPIDEAGNERVANSTNIIVQGEPVGATAEELDLFYSSFNFEIVSGGEYATFDTVVRNKLVFLDTLEGQNKQQIVVRVSAKYPKYEGITRFTTEEVTINAVYGVEVNNIAQMRCASKDQEEYAKQEGNMVEFEEPWFDHTVEARGERYVSYKNPYSLNQLAIVLGSNIAYEMNEDGTPVALDDNDRVHWYGNVYGNNHMFSTKQGQRTKWGKLAQIAWSNVTVSNIILRTNDLGSDAVITDGDDTKGFTGGSLQVQSTMDIPEKYMLENVRIEYSIIENAKQAAVIRGSDVTFDGCILRNLSQAAIHMPSLMYQDADDGTLYYLNYGILRTNNIVVSNSLGTFGSFGYDDFVKYDSSVNKGGFRFADTEEENKEYFMEHFASLGVNAQFIQTGFIDIYNWQDVNQANLIDTGSDKYNSLIKQFSGPLVTENDAFYQGRITDEDTTWFHMGFIVTGQGGAGLLGEPVYMDVQLEDNRFYHIYSKDIRPVEGASSLANLGASALSAFEIHFYGYRYDNVDRNGRSILPEMRYSVDSALIARLHGEN